MRFQPSRETQSFTAIFLSSYEPPHVRVCVQVILFGKRIVLKHVDDFTLDWYARHMPEARHVLPQAYDAPAASYQPTPAEHFNGYGPSHDERFAEPEDDDGTDDGVVLRFKARLHSPERDPERFRLGAPTTLYDMTDAGRDFVVSFFPGDSSCMVVELQSAVNPGGIFLKKAPYRYHETSRDDAFSGGGDGGGKSGVVEATVQSERERERTHKQQPQVVARRFRSTDFVRGAVVSFESEPLSGSRREDKNIPSGPASARFIIGEADAYAQE